MLIALFVSLFVATSGATSQDEFILVAHPDVAEAAVSREIASDLFLKRMIEWSDGSPVRPVDQSPRRSVRSDFSRRIHGRSVSAIQNYWKKRIFSGRSVPPPELPGDAEVISYVRHNPGAVGYVSAGSALLGVKVIPLAD